VVSACVSLGGRYELDQRIGTGAYGEVWRAADLVLARQVAVKLLYAGFADHPETLSRFRAEGRYAGRLCHENITRVYDYGEPDGTHPPFLVIELIDGPSLAGLLRDGALGQARTARIIAQTAAGLDAAHRAGLIHRDIKPANLLIGPGGTIKITDFGVAAAVGSAPVTQTNLIVGTPGYLAPERVAGSRATPAADLYALGIVGYECLSGRPPFGGSALQVAMAHREQPLPPLPASVPPELAALVRDLTAKDPGSRPGNAAEVSRRAGQLADRLEYGPDAPGAPGFLPVPGPVPAPVAWPAAATSWPSARRRPGRRMALAAAAVVMGVAGLVTSSEVGSPAAPHAMAQPSAASAPTMASAATVEVSAGTLTGQPVTAVVRQLRQLGLTVRVVWRASGNQVPGTVLRVQPAGRHPVGSLVTVIGAFRPDGHRAQAGGSPRTDPGPGHGAGNGKGNGNGQGQGNGQGHANGPGHGAGDEQGNGTANAAGDS
jgi:serine/threonine-protein kinase